jgi:hypothetical protein
MRAWKTPLAFSVKSIPCGMGEIRLRRVKYLPYGKCEIFCFAKCEGSFLRRKKHLYQK